VDTVREKWVLPIPRREEFVEAGKTEADMYNRFKDFALGKISYDEFTSLVMTSNA
jgi:hypothetical protein